MRPERSEGLLLWQAGPSLWPPTPLTPNMGARHSAAKTETALKHRHRPMQVRAHIMG
jgi:hypothetical protein